ncbi:MAG: hypothetical protein EA405_12960 [Rhodospirillales bacterium]|nr:MAG: hypothetical protein EA405_12960 [Rhodospirillales bacterium]
MTGAAKRRDTAAIMTKRPSDAGGGSARESREDREKRLAEALRANLKRRKAQARGRAASDEPPPDKT